MYKPRTFDLAIVGAGIVGLAHALAAARLGKRVVVIDRDARAVGASIRNFGFVTVTGQAAGATWRRARRSRDIWAEVAPFAGIDIEHEGLVMAAKRPEACAVVEAFLETEMGEDCRIMGPGEASEQVPGLRRDAISAVLWSPHEMRVESRTAIPRLAGLLNEQFGVTFRRSAAVHSVEPEKLETTVGPIEAEGIIVCPGDDLITLFPDRIARYNVTRCQLQMMRIDPAASGFSLGAAVMSDLGLVRYAGYAALPEARDLRRVIEVEQPDHLAHGVHLIAVQSQNGSLVVGDSHAYHATPEPFGDVMIDDLILDELDSVLKLPDRRVTERWVGTYASSSDHTMFVDAPDPSIRIVIVTGGTGASTAFAIGEEVIDDLFGSRQFPINDIKAERGSAT